MYTLFVRERLGSRTHALDPPVAIVEAVRSANPTFFHPSPSRHPPLFLKLSRRPRLIRLRKQEEVKSNPVRSCSVHILASLTSPCIALANPCATEYAEFSCQSTRSSGGSFAPSGIVRSPIVIWLTPSAVPVLAWRFLLALVGTGLVRCAEQAQVTSSSLLPLSIFVLPFRSWPVASTYVTFVTPFRSDRTALSLISDFLRMS